MLGANTYRPALADIRCCGQLEQIACHLLIFYWRVPPYCRYALLALISWARVKGGHGVADREGNKDLTSREHQILE